MFRAASKGQPFFSPGFNKKLILATENETAGNDITIKN
jgi:hypothetical protein